MGEGRTGWEDESCSWLNVLCILSPHLPAGSVLDVPEPVRHPHGYPDCLLLLHPRVRAGYEARHLSCTRRVAASEGAAAAHRLCCSQASSGFQVPQMIHCHLQYISFLQSLHSLSILSSDKLHQLLQLLQTGVDPGSSLPLQEWLHDLPVLVGG